MRKVVLNLKKMKILGNLKNDTLEALASSPGFSGIIFDVFGALPRKSNNFYDNMVRSTFPHSPNAKLENFKSHNVNKQRCHLE